MIEVALVSSRPNEAHAETTYPAYWLLASHPMRHGVEP
jgi:hypothetical protein